MARAPEPGRAKTRLIGRFGAEGAAALQRAFTEDLLERLCQADPWEVVVYISSHGPLAWPEVSALRVRPQAQGSLGERILDVFEQSRQDGVGKTVVLGTDSPDLPLSRVRQAFAALRRADAVVVPAIDGGYVLLGAVRPPKQLLSAIPWGGSEVLAATLEQARRHGLKLAVLEPWYDVDRSREAAFLAVHLELLELADGERRAPRTRQLLQELLDRLNP
jgi:rSAM/selenodomain-associated transferase 1